MNARSEGDETRLWLGARSGGTEGLAAHYVEGAGASTHSHSEWIVGRSSAFMNNAGQQPGIGRSRPKLMPICDRLTTLSRASGVAGPLRFGQPMGESFSHLCSRWEGIAPKARLAVRAGTLTAPRIL